MRGYDMVADLTNALVVTGAGWIRDSFHTNLGLHGHHLSTESRVPEYDAVVVVRGCAVALKIVARLSFRTFSSCLFPSA